MTENETIEKMKTYINESNKCKKQKKTSKQMETNNNKSMNTCKVKDTKKRQKQQKQEKTVKSKRKCSANLPISPQPGPSDINQMSSMSEEE